MTELICSAVGWRESCDSVLTGFIGSLERFAKCGVAVADQLLGVLQSSVFLLHLVDFSIQQLCLLPELLSLLCSLMKR